MRFFAFWLSNGTLVANLDDTVEYEAWLATPGPLVGDLFEQLLAEEEADASAWFLDTLRGEGVPAARLGEEHEPWRAVVARFARDLGEGRLGSRALLVGQASALEFVFQVLVNCVALSVDGVVLNEAQARDRAAQAMRWMLGGEPPDPLLEPWESELV